MANILILETSTTQCSVALAEQGKAVAWKEERADQGYIHAERLMPLVDEVMKEHGWTPSQLDAIAVSGGPGSFTGLRIGVATAKGLCHALNVPLIALDTLHLLAVQGERLDPKLQPRVAMIDARRMEVYAATFDASGECVRAAEPVEVDQRPDAFEGPAQFIGDGAVKCEEVLAGEGRTFVEAWPLARDGAALAEAKFVKGAHADLGSYEPNYIKAFKAGAPKDPLGLRSKVSVWIGALLLVLTSCTSCGEQQQYIPYVPVNVDINVNLPAYNDLAHVSQAIAIPGGSKGLYIRRNSLDEFIVLDRHSTFDVALGCQVILDDDNITLRDDGDCSESQWLMIDGSVMNGPAEVPLHRYRTTWNDPILQIYN